MIQSAVSFEGLLEKGLQAMEDRNTFDALVYFKRAAVSDFKKPQPWYWMGRIYRAQGKPESAGYAFFMALDLDRRFQPAREALAQLGYLSKEIPA
jgi:Tfp pilus assembly protein PilF